jgi:hypothetical protein
MYFCFVCQIRDKKKWIPHLKWKMDWGPPYGRYVTQLALRSATPYRDVSGGLRPPLLHIARPGIPFCLANNLEYV